MYEENLPRLLNEVDELKARLDELRPLPNDLVGRVEQHIQFEWTYHSNALEGNSLDLNETRMLLKSGITAKGKPLKDHNDIEGHQRVVEWLADFVKRKEPLTQYMIRSLHELLLKEPYKTKVFTPEGFEFWREVKIGQYKETPNYVFNKLTGREHHYATPEETPALMTELMDWYSAEQQKIDENHPDALHPIPFAVQFHYRFVAIHPFDDGNGRMGRILMNAILMQNGYPVAVIRKEAREEYLASLERIDASANDPDSYFQLTEIVVQAVQHSLNLYFKAINNESIEDFDNIFKRSALLIQKTKSILSEQKLSNDELQSLSNVGLTRFFLKFDEFVKTLSPLFEKILWSFQNSYLAPIYKIDDIIDIILSGNSEKFEKHPQLCLTLVGLKSKNPMDFEVKLNIKLYNRGLSLRYWLLKNGRGIFFPDEPFFLNLEDLPGDKPELIAVELCKRIQDAIEQEIDSQLRES